MKHLVKLWLELSANDTFRHSKVISETHKWHPSIPKSTKNEREREKKREKKEVSKVFLTEMLETIDILAEMLKISKNCTLAHYHYKSSCRS